MNEMKLMPIFFILFSLPLSCFGKKIDCISDVNIIYNSRTNPSEFTGLVQWSVSFDEGGIILLNGRFQNSNKTYLVNRVIKIKSTTLDFQKDIIELSVTKLVKMPLDTLPEKLAEKYFIKKSNIYQIQELPENSYVISNSHSPMYICKNNSIR
jgi:hypothetical protein